MQSKNNHSTDVKVSSIFDNEMSIPQLSLQKRFQDAVIDSDEEKDIRLLLMSPLSPDTISEDHSISCNDSASSEERSTEFADVHDIIKMESAIEAALAETYSPRINVSIGDDELSCDKSTANDNFHHQLVNSGNECYSDMDSDLSDANVYDNPNDLPLESGANLLAKISTEYLAKAEYHILDNAVSTSILDNDKHSPSHLQQYFENSSHLKGEYSDMSTDRSESNDDSHCNERLNHLSEPQLRSVELQPLARRSDDTIIGGRNQDYMGLAYMYKLQRPYADRNLHPMCVVCQQHPCRDVFFPCEHRCVCPFCMKKDKFCEEGNSMDDGYSLCPLCAGIIKRIYPFEGGLEIAKYWAWVEEISPALPPGFLRAFGHSASVLKKIYVEHKEPVADRDSICQPS